MAHTTTALHLLWLVALAATSTAYAQRAPAPIGTSVLITGFWDLLDGRVGDLTPCENAVWKSAGGYNAKTITFVVTINAIGTFNELSEYFYKGSNGTWLSVTPELTQRWQEGLAKCFKSAVDAGFEVLHILPHVDPLDTKGKGMWRNIVKFSPNLKVGPPGNETSYHDAVIVPVCNAINEVVPIETSIEFTVAGEQGYSVFTYPRRWMEVMEAARAMLSQGVPRAQHSFGVSFNHDKVCGCVEPGESDPIIYNNTYAARFNNFTKAGGLKTIDLPGVMELLNSSDFIGVSAYSPMPLPTTILDMERPAQTIAFELSFFNISLSDLLLKQNMKFVHSEQGLGGCENGGRVAKNLTYLTGHPYLGAWPPGGFNPAINPWAVPLYAQYRREMYGLLSNWAARGGGPQYRIDNIYMWSVGTWDILGVHHSSSNWRGSYGEPYLRNMVANHNGYAHNVSGYDLSKVTASMPPGGQTVVDTSLEANSTSDNQPSA